MLSARPSILKKRSKCAVCGRMQPSGEYVVAVGSDVDGGAEAILCGWCFLHSIDDAMHEYVMSACRKHFPNETRVLDERMSVLSKVRRR